LVAHKAEAHMSAWHSLVVNNKDLKLCRDGTSRK